jgi:uncharacterized membrane protein
MTGLKTTLAAVAAGAAAMYFSDPDRGNRRRALARDRSVGTWNDFTGLLDKARRDAANRTRGTGCAIAGVFRKRPADDQVLVDRVRTRLGRLVSHPHAIDVTARDGTVTLKGDVLRSEFEALVRRIGFVRGVKHVEQELRVHDSSEHISSLQGGVRRETRSEFTQQNWTPALRIAAGALGSSLLSYAVRKDGARAVATGLAGAALLGRAVCNRELSRMLGIRSGRRAVEFEKCVHIQAPVEEVFRYWADYEKLPRFMTHLKEVRDLGNGKSHWVAEGPGGISTSWDAERTKHIPNKLLAWRSLPGSGVETEGVVRFDANANGGTRVSIRMGYKPPAGMVGHYILSLFGADPRSEIDEDMVRLKSLIELGKTRAHGVQVTREMFQHA